VRLAEVRTRHDVARNGWSRGRNPCEGSTCFGMYADHCRKPLQIWPERPRFGALRSVLEPTGPPGRELNRGRGCSKIEKLPQCGAGGFLVLGW